jgi:hypothetical protein
MKEKTLEGRARGLEEAAKKPKKWEYKVLSGAPYGYSNLVADLHKCGEEGWEVCTMAMGAGTMVILKREIIED